MRADIFIDKTEGGNVEISVIRDGLSAETRSLTEEKLKEEMIHPLRVELKAIHEWNRSTTLLRTQTEKDAVVFRAIHREEIEALLLEIASQN